MIAVFIAAYDFGAWVMLAGAAFGAIAAARGDTAERRAGFGLGVMALLLAIVLIDPVDLLDGPMRLGEDGGLAGTGSPMFDALRNMSGGPVLWLALLCGAGFLIVLWRSWATGPLRTAGILGLTGIFLHLGGLVGMTMAFG